MVYAEDVKTERAADEASDESSEKADGSDENAQSDEAEENVVLGEVKSVSDTEITIAVGTMKEMGQPGGKWSGPDDYYYREYCDYETVWRYAAGPDWRRRSERWSTGEARWRRTGCRG